MPPNQTPESDALRALAGGPRMHPNELRRQLRLSPDTFLAAWNGSRHLPPAAQRRLFSLLADEVARLQGLLRSFADRAQAISAPPLEQPDDWENDGAS